MIALQLTQTLYEYNAWANGRILDTSQQLTDAQFLAPTSMSFPSVRDTLIHIISVQRNWLARFQSLSSPETLEANSFPNMNSIRAIWSDIERETQQFVAALDEASLGTIIHYTNDQGEPNAYPLWQMMVHQINHATEHRSEVAVVLTQFGYSPGWLDFLVYIDTLAHNRGYYPDQP